MSNYTVIFYVSVGHSRTIVGIEEHNDGNLRLLVFDPSTSQKQMQQFLHSINTNLMRTLRRGMYALRAKQYQIVAVTGILPDKRYDVSINSSCLIYHNSFNLDIFSIYIMHAPFYRWRILWVMFFHKIIYQSFSRMAAKYIVDTLSQ